MQTICPHCHTVFKVSDEHLKVADGYVRCGICKEVFNALEKDQPKVKKEPVTNSAITGTPAVGIKEKIKSGNTDLTQPASEQNTRLSASANAVKPLISQKTANKTDETPVTKTTRSGDTAQTVMSAAPSEAKSPEPRPAMITAKTIEAKTIKPDTPKADLPATETRAKPVKKPEQLEEKNLNTADDVTSNAPKQPSAFVTPTPAPAPSATPKTSTSNTAVTKNITYDDVDDNLFDGVQSKLIPDEYRIPELHNTYSIWHDIAWSLAILMLTASLFAEYTWFNRNELISNPQLRPLVTQLCILVNCDAMSLREPGEIEMTTRNIYTHPNVRNALMISGTLINHADFEQPYPNILIAFSDVRGEVIASRIFTPEDYLQIKATSLRPLPPRIPINFNMEIQDPGKNAMTYEFSFL